MYILIKMEEVDVEKDDQMKIRSLLEKFFEEHGYSREKSRADSLKHEIDFNYRKLKR